MSSSAPRPSVPSPSSPAAPPGTLYGTQTRLAAANFPGPGRRLSGCPAFLRAYAQVKAAAAAANVRLGVLDEQRGGAVRRACREIIEGRWDDQFVSPLLLGGGGTSTNMNVNEVVAARATALLDGTGVTVHPNDHVNAGQSTNDTYPTAMALAVRELTEAPRAALASLATALDAKAAEYDGLRRLGRTCLQDAASLTVGETHRAQAAAVRRGAEGLERAAGAFLAVPLGATAVGSGVGAPEGYAAAAVAELAAATGLPLVPAPDLFDALAHLDPYSALAAAAVRAVLTLGKIAADLRLLSSGPAGGLGEVTLPAVQAGSSIMPGKINPVIPEYVMQLGYRVRGCATTVDLAVAAGELELNVMEPAVLDALITLTGDLESAACALEHSCVRGLRWNGSRVDELAAHAYDGLITDAAANGYDVTSVRVEAARAAG